MKSINLKKMEFWNSQLTEKSWKILQELKRKYDFILIGGWAIYLWTKQKKSKDIDIVVSIDELQKLKAENLSKNDHLKKYEIKTGEIDIDIYVSHFSKLAVAPENLEKYARDVEGFRVISQEVLLVLKQGAYEDRKNSTKGEKDKIDILSLLFFSDINLKHYKSVLKEYSLTHYLEGLLNLVRSFNDYNSLGLTPRELKLKKKAVLEDLRKL